MENEKLFTAIELYELGTLQAASLIKQYINNKPGTKKITKEQYEQLLEYVKDKINNWIPNSLQYPFQSSANNLLSDPCDSYNIQKQTLNGESEYWIDGLPYEKEEYNKLVSENNE